MYQVIEGGKAGMFRVGDWNVKKWDQASVLGGDFLIGPWPGFDGRKNSVVIGGMRGVAVPENSPNRAIAIEFAKFMLTKPAQQASLDNVGSGVRKDLDTNGLSERQKQFAASNWTLAAYDFPEAVHAFYPELEAAYHRKLMGALAKPPANWKAFITETANEMRELSARLASARK
jgi:ABC-type glycerol-3-phosphate transport system substrate-binding protein